jgi:hypothetical protein
MLRSYRPILVGRTRRHRAASRPLTGAHSRWNVCRKLNSERDAGRIGLSSALRRSPQR